jgi:hypothetical protein
MNVPQCEATSSAIPKISCPVCDALMRLMTIEPEGYDNHDRMTFRCDCGFEYRMSERSRGHLMQEQS